jgi:hypothetical protein
VSAAGSTVSEHIERTHEGGLVVYGMTVNDPQPYAVEFPDARIAALWYAHLAGRNRRHQFHRRNSSRLYRTNRKGGPLLDVGGVVER